MLPPPHYMVGCGHEVALPPPPPEPEPQGATFVDGCGVSVLLAAQPGHPTHVHGMKPCVLIEDYGL